MGFFTPTDCTIDYSTQNWLLVGIAGLTLVVIASLGELVALWRRSGVSWETWPPLAPTLIWAIVCALLAGQAIGWYRDEAVFLSGSSQPVGGPIDDPLGECFAIAQTGRYIQFALAVGIVLLAIGMGVLVQAPRRRAS
jgi:hypothetical protein